jgi:hypothetical protein
MRISIGEKKAYWIGAGLCVGALAVLCAYVWRRARARLLIRPPGHLEPPFEIDLDVELDLDLDNAVAELIVPELLTR